ncbi:MAG: uroporphyrinogen decarboxylase family protein, partial [Victivallaceae bacterium]|nr:uroporphyrinogen decarboxylase family protein [Victivallaceae bacterium]
LIGMENLFIYLYDNPDEIKLLIEKIYNYISGVLDMLESFRNDIHAVHLGDDWGTQQAPLMSIEMFRDFYKPYYKEIIRKIHNLGMDVWLHTDGKVNNLIGEFIDMKLDVINLQQCNVLGIEDIRQKYRGRITFDCPVDIQRTLPSGSREQIEDEAKRLLEEWGTPCGGFIATDYGSTDQDHQAIGCSRRQAQTALAAFKKFGRYK